MLYLVQNATYNVCGLVYVGQTKGRLNTRMCGHRSGIKNNLFPEDYHHFRQPDHSNLCMNNFILGKIYHPSIMTKLIVQVTYLVQDASVMNIFDKSPRRKLRHCHRQYASPKLHDVSINGLLPYVQTPLGMNNIRTKLHSLLLSKLHSLYATCLKTSTSGRYSTLYNLTYTILDIGQTQAVQARDDTWE